MFRHAVEGAFVAAPLLAAADLVCKLEGESLTKSLPFLLSNMISSFGPRNVMSFRF